MATTLSMARALAGFRLGIWAFSYALFTAMLVVGSGGSLSGPAIMALAGGVFVGFALGGLVQAAVDRTASMPLVRRLMFVAATVLAITALNAAIDVATLGQVLTAPAQRTGTYYSSSLLQSFSFLFWIHAFVAATVWLARMSVDLIDKERRLVLVEAQAQSAVLTALRAQVNPHFLFNALNATASLIASGRNAEAEEVILRLSEFFRASLRADRTPTISLSEEFETLDAYLQIEQIRFPDRLVVDMECPAALEDARVPHLLLQPLAENAIKYAVAPAARPVRVSIRASAVDGRLKLSVEDNGETPPEATAPGEGFGLRNVEQRLAALYGEDGRILVDTDANGFRVSVELPLSFGGAQ